MAPLAAPGDTSSRDADPAGGLPVVKDGCVIGDRWGVSDSETLRSYPCDDFVAALALQLWRGVRVEVPADAVWPWVAQVRIAHRH